MRNYFYRLMRNYISFLVLPQGTAVEIEPGELSLVSHLPNGRHAWRSGKRGKAGEPDAVDYDSLVANPPDYLVLAGDIHHERDIQKLLAELRQRSHAGTRLILTYYSALWRPLAKLASALGLRTRAPETNWLSHEDVANLLRLEDFELVRRDSRVIFPLPIPLLATLANRFLAPLPFINAFSLVSIVVAKPAAENPAGKKPAGKSVSIIIPARNEAGNIRAAVERLPAMGPDDEIIFVEGNSSDDTWAAILAVKVEYEGKRRILACQQEGKGKGDAVRKGFSLAQNPVLMILDADLTVPPEDLPKFHAAIVSGKGEFINGSRLVYPMEKRAMRFANMIANKAFAIAFSYVLGQPFKDTLCGTKVLSRENYERLAANRAYFGDFDPFGDFDLIFGASRMGLKIIEIPVNYRERVYGDTNISRWRHGAILLRMLGFAARRIKFI